MVVNHRPPKRGKLSTGDSVRPIQGKKQIQRNPRALLRILLIDDEALLLKSYSRYLRRSGGHEVVTASNGSEALEELEGDDAFDLVFCDLSMPDVSGVDVHRSIRQFHPELIGRFVFLTGGIKDSASEAYVQESGVPILGKPVPLAEFEKILAGAL